MDSNTEICNLALSRLGEENILSLTDGSANAVLCNQFFATERDFLFRMYPWNFSTKRANLQRITVNPVWEYAYAYQLPNDCLKVLALQDETYEPYKLEGRTIVTDKETVKIKYSALILDSAQYDANFSPMFSARLAAVMCYKLTKSRSLTRDMWEVYEQYEMDAFSSDGQEGTPEVLEDRSLIDARW